MRIPHAALLYLQKEVISDVFSIPETIHWAKPNLSLEIILKLRLFQGYLNNIKKKCSPHYISSGSPKVFYPKGFRLNLKLVIRKKIDKDDFFLFLFH